MRDPLARLLADPGAARRVLVVVAHPDDEVLGCGGLLARLPDPRVVHVTDGAPREGDDARRHGFADTAAYAAARATEAETALAIAGHGPACLRRLGIADQEASLHLARTARALHRDLDWAEVVLTHAYEGGHSDHDAVAFAVAAARALAGSAATLVEMPFYRAALPSETGAEPGGWVRQRFIPHRGAGPERRLVLGPGEQDRKRRMVDAHRSQGDTLRAFALDTERFRIAPAHDILRPPHAGEMLYERHGWNLTAALWRARVAAAQADLAAAAA